MSNKIISKELKKQKDMGSTSSMFMSKLIILLGHSNLSFGA